MQSISVSDCPSLTLPQNHIDPPIHQVLFDAAVQPGTNLPNYSEFLCKHKSIQGHSGSNYRTPFTPPHFPILLDSHFLRSIAILSHRIDERLSGETTVSQGIEVFLQSIPGFRLITIYSLILHLGIRPRLNPPSGTKIHHKASQVFANPVPT
jgi:hypothetical protein